MARPKFQKGNKFGGKSPGRPRISDEVRAARKFTQVEFDLAVSKIFFLRFDELKKLAVANSTTTMEGLIARIALKGMSKGSTHELNYFVERFFGKVAENHNFTGNAHPDLVSYIEKINAEHARNEETNGSGQEGSKKDSKEKGNKSPKGKESVDDWC